MLGSQLAVGTNTISLRITVSGVIRTLTLTAQKIVGMSVCDNIILCCYNHTPPNSSLYVFILTYLFSVAVFNPTCSVSYDSDWNVGCTCVGGGGSEAIQSITYTINGGIQRTGKGIYMYMYVGKEEIVCALFIIYISDN